MYKLADLLESYIKSTFYQAMKKSENKLCEVEKNS